MLINSSVVVVFYFCFLKKRTEVLAETVKAMSL